MSDKRKVEIDRFDNRVHLLGSLHPCSLSTACGAMMQPGAAGAATWSNEVNYWGKTRIRIERPWTTITLDPSKVTCRRKGCKQ
jgi:hypothetical protein